MIQLTNITKSYHIGNQEFQVLKGVSLHIEQGDFVAIMGQSGSGKSTLMNIIGLLDTPSSGNYTLNNRNIKDLDEDDLADVRSKTIGFVFQSYNLLPRMSAIKQVEVPLRYQGIPKDKRRAMAKKALEEVGLGDKLESKPNELSGGQQQRISIARAIAANPSMILADEPTGALDSQTGNDIMDILKRLNDQGHTIVIITHEPEIAARAKKLIRLKDGHIVV